MRAMTFLLVLLLAAASMACGDDGATGNQNDNGNGNQPTIQCGNVVVEGAEECDDGPANSDVARDACRTDCRLPRCGDGAVDSAEECDDGPANSDTIADACRAGCRLPSCGDGVLDVVQGEECDGGDALPSAGCDADCLVRYCGNGVVEPGEACDDGNTNPGDGCSADCRSDETCGNGIPDVWVGEGCDCGDGSGSLPAGCDRPNGTATGSTCDDACQPMYCGNGAVDPGEVCDDGNTTAGDGCSADCRSSERCGNGTVDPATPEVCDCGDGTVPLPAGCSRPNGATADAECDLSCQPHGCGDGLRYPPEQCEETDLGGTTCSDLGYYWGELACGFDCRYDDSGCGGSCGDGEVNGPEMCEGAPLLGQSCIDLGYDTGHLSCTSRCVFGRHECARIGWLPMASGATATLRSVWGSGSRDVDAVGDSGVIRHWDGVEWTSVPSGTAQTLHAVWGLDAGNRWAVGDGGTILHGTGAGWAPMTSGTTANLRGIWGTSASSLWVVAETGAIRRYDGVSWTAVSYSYPGGLAGIWGSGANDVWAAGSLGSLAHWNGSTWTTVPLPGIGACRAIWGSAATDIWVTRASGTVTRWNGAAWTDLAPPATDATLPASPIHGSGPGQVMTTGGLHTVRRWDGEHWMALQQGNTPPLHGLWVRSAREAFAVGEGGTILRYPGRGWTEPAARQASPTTGDIDSIWAASPTAVFLIETTYCRVWRFDGSAFTDITPNPMSTLPQWVLSGVSRDSVFSLGYGTGGARHVLHWNGSTWTDWDTGAPGWLWDLWAAADDDVFVVGDQGAILRFDGSGWNLMPTGTTERFRSIWGAAPDDVWAAIDWRVFHFDGAAWSAGDFTGFTRDLWGTGPDDVHLTMMVGAQRWTGTAWSPVPANTPSELGELTGSNPEGLFATSGSDVFHLYGGQWERLALPSSHLISAGFATPTTAYFAGRDGAFNVLHWETACEATETACTDGLDEDCDGLVDCQDADCDFHPACS